MAVPGDILCFERAHDTLMRSVSTYGFYDTEYFPVKDEPYVIKSHFDSVYEVAPLHSPERNIGWELIYYEGTYYARVAQRGYDPVELRVTGVGRANEGFLPSSTTIKFVTMDEKPQMAVIEESKYEEEDEVQSVGRDYKDTPLKQCERERHLRNFLVKEFSYEEVRELFV
ncbi:hypothetical protein EBT31_02920 [bacterium]|nr:hypothetical protein [bacterium]NBX48632.1 hypothetical protein [bacterium]